MNEINDLIKETQESLLALFQFVRIWEVCNLEEGILLKPDLRLLASRTMREKFLLQAIQSVVLYYSRQNRLR